MTALDIIHDPVWQQQAHQVAYDHLAAKMKNGERVEQSPRKLAIVHEVGHAIQHFSEGVPVTSIEVFIDERASQVFGHTSWGGWCTAHGGPHGWGEKKTKVASMSLEALTHAIRMTISGYVGETVLYKKKIPLGSSMDELLVSQTMATWAAEKCGADPQKIWIVCCAECAWAIKRNETAVHKLIHLLNGRDKIEGEKLQAALALVKPYEIPDELPNPSWLYGQGK